MTQGRYPRIALLAVSITLFSLCALVPWHADAAIRNATAIVLVVLLLWISEIAPLGVIALGIPIAATLTGLLTWKQAVAAWGDPTVFLFLGAFLLARGLEKYGAFDWLLTLHEHGRRLSAGRLAILVLLISGTISTVQNNTAVTAMLLPAVVVLAKRTASPVTPLLALSFGATFGGLATPVGTAPNFIGYAAMREIDPAMNFIAWMKVGVPVWLGTTAIGWAVLHLADRMRGRVDVDSIEDSMRDSETRTSPLAYARIPPPPPRGFGRVAAIAALVCAATAWLTVGVIKSGHEPTHPLHVWVERFVPDALPPMVAALALFLIPLPRKPNEPGTTVLDRQDFQALDWDTLFLIAGGLCLGRTLEASGAAESLAQAVRAAQLSPLLLMLALGGVTVLLSELTSNTATAALVVPLARAMSAELGIDPLQAIWLVALCASLGFALPVSTPPNALVYGTRLVPLRRMMSVGIVVDAACLVWIVFCMRWLA